MIDFPKPDFTVFDDDNSDYKESQTQSFTHINCHQLAQMIKEYKEKSEIRELVLLDCRYKYEYDKGHIKNARSVNFEGEIQGYFTRINESEGETYNDTIFVFYCEFSINRGPQMASIFRQIDRSLNYKRYPFIYYENVLILTGGFQKFYQEYPELCEGYHFPMWNNSSLISNNNKQRKEMTKKLFANDENNDKIHFSMSQPAFLKK